MLINFDVTTLIALVSLFSQDYERLRNVSLDHPELNRQKEQEAIFPILNELNPYLTNSDSFIAHHNVIEKFMSIVQEIGGEKEKERAVILVKSIKRVTATENVTLKGHNRHINSLCVDVASVGKQFNALTLTSNRFLETFCESNDINVKFHDSRSLIEKRIKK